MKRWDLNSLAPSSEKETPRAPTPEAPRVPRAGAQMPQVLFSTPECRAVVIRLESGGEIGDHQVRERAVVQVVEGRVTIESSDGVAECPAGTLVVFEPGESHAVKAIDDSRLLLILAPWPARGHDVASEEGRAEHLPVNAVVDPLPPA
jgi:quercetin dioxygenase-like cupin family protein